MYVRSCTVKDTFLTPCTIQKKATYATKESHLRYKGRNFRKLLMTVEKNPQICQH